VNGNNTPNFVSAIQSASSYARLDLYPN